MKVSLIEADKNRIEMMFNWFNSEDGWRIKRNKRKWSFTEFAEFVKYWIVNFIKVKDGRTSNVVGYVAFSSFDYQNNRAEMHLYISRKHRKKGIGRKVVELSFDQFFKDEAMNKLKARIPSYNKDVIELAKKTGMKEEGILKKEMYSQGRYVDIHIFGLIKNDYIDMIEEGKKEKEKPEEPVKEPEMAMKE